ncbi:MAG: L-histidine N(alpha)-methyltransferase [Nitrospira sp. LK265]|nr:L-histidine N(alpha)-methyltransferase [Nitrospira sp. LK265]
MSMPPFDVLSVDAAPRTDAIDAFADAVRHGLTQPQRELPSCYLYDEVGSALYEAITLLPEYGLSRADERLLFRHADRILGLLPDRLIVTELGSGSARKTRWLLQALVNRAAPLIYIPIDLSASALRNCRKELFGLGGLSLVGLERSYLEGLQEVAVNRPPDHTLLVLFLGSTLGNFERSAAEEFLSGIRRNLQPGDALLMGTDLEKPKTDLLLAYDDPLGVTAAFNRNLLVRVNRELNGGFVLSRFHHDVRYDEGERRIEMHLRSDRRQTVRIEHVGLTCEFQSDETIWTESCHKFNLDELRAMAVRNGFHSAAQWIDNDWPFVESLWFAD